MDTLKDSPKDSIETTDARHLRLIDQHGHEQSRCTFAEFIRDNEREDGGEEALLDVYQALANARNPTCWIEGGALAHAWLNLGAGGVVGLVIVDGPVVREPSPDDVVCSECGNDKIEVEAWIDANTGEPSDSDGPGKGVWCHVCEDTEASVCLRSEFVGAPAEVAPAPATLSGHAVACTVDACAWERL